MSVTLEDIRLSGVTLNELKDLAALRDTLLSAPVEVCIERAGLITEYMQAHDGDGQPPIIFRANTVAHYLKNKEAVFPDGNLLAGTTGSKLKSAPLYPEYIGMMIWAELNTISTREKNPQVLSKEDAQKLNFHIYPYWLDRDVLSATKKEFGESISTRMLEKIIFFVAGKAGCISHTVPFFERVLQEGLDAIIEEAEQKAAQKTESKDFYNAASIVLKGFLRYVRHLGIEAHRLAQNQKNPKDKARFLRMARACAHVPAKPASGFYEAVSCLWLCLVAIHAENMNMAISPGRLDQVLYPYYQADIASGILTVEEALEIVGNLWIKIGDNVNLVPEMSEELFGGAGTAPAVTLGGINKEGEDAVNDLTYIMLRATELLGLREPNMNARFHYEKNEKRYRNRVAEVIAKTKAIPAFHNDAANIETLHSHGASIEHARDYAIIGCVELGIPGRSYDSSSAVILNLTAPLEMAMYNGRRYSTGEEQFGPSTGELEDFTNFNDFWTAFQKQTGWLIGQAIDLNEQMAKIHQQMLPTPLLSALFDGPLTKGCDLICGGAIYNSSGVTHVGFADVVDSLNAIRYLLEETHYTMRLLQDALKADYDGYEYLRQIIKHYALKYGTKAESESGMSGEVIRFLHDTYQSHTNHRGGKYRPAYWTMTQHSGLGQVTHALPSGRRAALPFSSGITPTPQAVRSLPECLNSVAALGCENIPGGEALNIKFSS
ncbi:MAG: hypothetical protein LBB91_03275, partial [Clostridiales bacterium]|nr:hypothetical protein [Clostridiales bacterium]